MECICHVSFGLSVSQSQDSEARADEEDEEEDEAKGIQSSCVRLFGRHGFVGLRNICNKANLSLMSLRLSYWIDNSAGIGS